MQVAGLGAEADEAVDGVSGEVADDFAVEALYLVLAVGAMVLASRIPMRKIAASVGSGGVV